MLRLALLLAFVAPSGWSAPWQQIALGGANQPAPVTWSAAVQPGTVQAGQTAQLRLDATIEPGWRVYALRGAVPAQALSVEVEAPAGITAGALAVPDPLAGYDAIFEADYEYLAEAGRATVPLRVAPDAASGPRTVTANVRYIVCNDELCLPPRTVPVSAALTVAAAPAADAQAEDAGGPEAEAPAVPEAPADASVDSLAGGAPPDSLGAAPAAVDRASGPPAGVVTLPASDAKGAGGLWAFLLLAVGAGLAALLTPCVFPMIPLTVSYFTHGAGDRKRGIKKAIVFGASIVVIFTGLGVITALVVGEAGAQTIAASPWVNLFIGGVLVAFGFSMLGFFDLRLPHRWVNFFNRQADARDGYAGVLFMGTTLTLVSFSCTVPFVGGLLAATARAEWAYPILGMLVFSGVFALPFVGFALFPNALSKLPRSGTWMQALKATFGFVELAAAIKFFSNADLVWGLGVLPRALAVALAVVIFALAGFYLLGKLRLSPEADDRPVTVGPWRLASAVGFFGLALYFVPGLFGGSLGLFNAYLPPQTEGGFTLGTAEPSLEWIEERAPAFEQASRTGEPVFIDFTGYTCTNCRYMEETVFSRPEIAERFREDFVLLRLWTDAADQAEELQAYQLELTGLIALPTYAIVRPDGSLAALHSGVASAEEFVAFLEAGRAAAVSEDGFAQR